MEQDNSSKAGCIWITVIVIIIITGSGYFYIKNNYWLPIYGKVTYGKIIDATNTGKSTKSIIYEYKISTGEVFRGSSTATEGFLGCWRTRECIGKYYKVRYAENYPKISQMYLNEVINDTLRVE